jgi:V/A-type H+-transporting ATPase subunit A
MGVTADNDRESTTGSVVRVAGPLVVAEGLPNAAMFDVALVGTRRLPGEVIDLDGSRATIQVYEYTGGVSPGDPVTATGLALSAELGPELLGGVFDGLLRALGRAEDLLVPGTTPMGLSHEKHWHLDPSVAEGDQVDPGAVLGVVSPSDGVGAVTLRALVPPTVGGRLDWMASPGTYRSDETIAMIDGVEVAMTHRWPARLARPAATRLTAIEPLVTGQRVLDFLYPIAKGSTAAVPGGFGTGKTVMLQQIAKWCAVDVIVYVGCGERGNEMADVTAELAALEDPRTGHSLLERVVLIANTSNMPVMAREASIYMGVTAAEYFRDMGLDVVVIADSTSRWAEATREVSSRMRQLPAEEGYPAGLASALAAFYERAGRFATLGGGEGTVSILGAVSPQGGDMSEPVTAHTRRFVRAVWSLDRDLAYARHYPAVTWRESFTRDAAAVGDWYLRGGDSAWAERRRRALALLAEADHLESIVQLIGSSALPDRERIILLVARLLREGVLQQNALAANDATSSPGKTGALVDLVLAVYETCQRLLANRVPASVLEETDLSIAFRAREAASPDGEETVRAVTAEVVAKLEALA